MDYNKATVSIGKVRNYDNCVGDIITKNGIFIFTHEDILDGEIIKKGDIVIFRAEEIQNQNKAFFIKKLAREKKLTPKLYTKKKLTKFLKENE